MALIAAKCPSCGGDIQLDDSREFGFCLHCGTKVIVQDAVQKIKVSGSVKLDMSDTAVNCLNLADQAFQNQNYLEAYNYYTKMLEYDSSSYKATFRKGLCAGYLSDQASIRTNELISGYKLAIDMLDTLIKQGNPADVLYAEQRVITQELYDFALQCSSIIKNMKYGSIFGSREEIDTYLKTGMSITNMLTEVNGAIDEIVAGGRQHPAAPGGAAGFDRFAECGPAVGLAVARGSVAGYVEIAVGELRYAHPREDFGDRIPTLRRHRRTGKRGQ
jgi:hypothetical protein